MGNIIYHINKKTSETNFENYGRSYPNPNINESSFKEREFTALGTSTVFYHFFEGIRVIENSYGCMFFVIFICLFVILDTCCCFLIIVNSDVRYHRYR